MRPEKANIVSDLSDKLKGSPFLLVTDYQRMKVDQFSELRNRLAPGGAQSRGGKKQLSKTRDGGFRDAGRCRPVGRPDRDRDGRKGCRASGEDSQNVRRGI